MPKLLKDKKKKIEDLISVQIDEELEVLINYCLSII